MTLELKANTNCRNTTRLKLRLKEIVCGLKSNSGMVKMMPRLLSSKSSFGILLPYHVVNMSISSAVTLA